MLYVLDVDVKPRWKYWYNLVFDSLTGFFNVTKGSALNYQDTAEMSGRLRHSGFAEVQVIPFARRDLAARVLYIAKKGGAPQIASSNRC